MPSTPKKRPKQGSRVPKPVSEPEPPSSSSSSFSPRNSSIMEPPQNLFPSKEELLRLVAVLAIASFVVFTCHFIASLMNPVTKPFCDSNVDSSPDSISDSVMCISHTNVSC
uniref:Uncharacterized protein MANES_17G019300 n=1 Tax=Rhizophora mucronata TaxID=61149 RepID=A0A2P2JVF1_RHIMU